MLSSVNSFIFRRRSLVIFLCVCICLTVVWVLRSENTRWREMHFVKFITSRVSHSHNSTKRMKNPGLILDTPGCRIPKFDPFDPSVVELFEARDEPYPCDGSPLFMRSQPDGSIHVNETALEEHYHLKINELHCRFMAIRRLYEKPGNVRENDYEIGKPQKLQFDVPLNEDQVKVVCNVKQKEPFIQYFPLIRLKPKIEEIKSKQPEPVPRLNLIVTGVDSISKLNFLRHFRKTHSFIKNKGTFLDMKGYTKVGDNTFPNLNPLLTGRFPQDIWNETLKDTMYFDDTDIIWKRFAKSGYRTLYAEDSPFFGLYNFGRRGFNETPTDYYIRPLYLALHNSEVRNKGNWYCFNKQLEPDLIYDYTRDFVKAMGTTRPYFAFPMTSALTHDYLNHAGYADFPLVQFLEDLWDMGAHNNSVIVIFGDHGLRFGAIRQTYIGKYEERMPYLYIHFPTWFMEQYPAIAQNLRENQERLVTFFDVHATMIQLLDPTRELTQKERMETSPYGLSLMGKISPYRTCVLAHIYPHWCCCHVMENVSGQDPLVLKSVEILMECINNELRKFKSSTCPAMEVDEITRAQLGQLNDLVLRFVKHENIVIDRNVVYGDRIVKYEDYLITITTKPDGKKFESTIRRDVVEDTYCVVDVFEIDAPASSCIDVGRLENFRYCA